MAKLAELTGELIWQPSSGAVKLHLLHTKLHYIYFWFRILKIKYAAESSSKPLLKLTSYLVFSITKSLLSKMKY